MKSAWFILLSVSLHAAALVYPVSFGGPVQTQLIEVTILPIEQAARSAKGQGGRKNHTVAREVPSRRAMPSAEPRREPETPANLAEPEPLPAKNVAGASHGNLAQVSAIVDSADMAADTISGAAGDNPQSKAKGVGLSESGNGSFGSSGSYRSGSGSGIGIASFVNSIARTQARYRDTPRPDYPESARREGREGRVLLRVFVDDQGRSQQVEIKSSSGTEALDRAAAEALKRWQFHPARRGDQPIASWVNVPIDFHLTDKK